MRPLHIQSYTSVYLLWMLVTSILLSGMAEAFADGNQPIATLQSLSGNVQVIDLNKKSLPAKQGQTLSSGQSVRTGSDGEAILKIKDGSTFGIRPNSVVPIDGRLTREKAVGTVLFVHGKTEVTSLDGIYRHAIKGGKIYQGDVIETATASSMQLDMVDGGYFAIRPDSKVAINDYVYQQKNTDKVKATLLRGGLRSITGAVGQTNKKNFSLSTPVATIGIRGTDLEVYYLSEQDAVSLAEKTGKATEAGSYLKVKSGEAVLKTEAFEQPVKSQEIAYTASPTVAPVFLTAEEAEEKAPVVFEEETYEEPIPGKNITGKDAADAEKDTDTVEKNKPSAITFKSSALASLSQTSQYVNVDPGDSELSTTTLPLIGRGQWPSDGGDRENPESVYIGMAVEGSMHYQPFESTEFYLGGLLGKRYADQNQDINQFSVKAGAVIDIGDAFTLSARFRHHLAESAVTEDLNLSETYQQPESGYETDQLVTRVDFRVIPTLNLFALFHTSTIRWDELYSDGTMIYNSRHEKELNLLEMGGRYQITPVIAATASLVGGEAITPSYDGFEEKEDLSGFKLKAEASLGDMNLFASVDQYQTEYSDDYYSNESDIQVLTLGGTMSLSKQLELNATSRHISVDNNDDYKETEQADLTQINLRYSF